MNFYADTMREGKKIEMNDREMNLRETIVYAETVKFV